MIHIYLYFQCFGQIFQEILTQERLMYTEKTAKFFETFSDSSKYCNHYNHTQHNRITLLKMIQHYIDFRGEGILSIRFFARRVIVAGFGPRRCCWNLEFLLAIYLSIYFLFFYLDCGSKLENLEFQSRRNIFYRTKTFWELLTFLKKLIETKLRY